jgi:hypothetical protein
MTPKVRRLLEQLVGAALALGFDTAIAKATRMDSDLQVEGWEIAVRRDDGANGKILGCKFLLQAALEGDDGAAYVVQVEQLFAFWSRGEGLEGLVEDLELIPRAGTVEDRVIELLGAPNNRAVEVAEPRGGA